MPKGKCPECGKEFFGWALLNGYDICECGTKLTVKKEVLTAYENPTKSKEIG